jgi:hypothetical protein
MEVKTETLLVILMGVLVIVAGLQAVQIGTLTTALQDGTLVAAGQATGSALSQLPTQVGGC